MHTVIVIAIGFGLLGLCVFGGHLVGTPSGLAAGALVFLPLWLIGAGINLYLGVKTAGYTVAEEAPIFLVVFAIPAVVALFTWWKFR
jgi:hypothetical protein